MMTGEPLTSEPTPSELAPSTRATVESASAEAVPPEFVSNPQLREGFETFVAAAQRLEESYRDLKIRADAVDRELAATNQKLHATLEERETVFSALPVGVISLDVNQERRFENSEAQRLEGEVAQVGVDLVSVPAGDHDFGPVSVRVSHVEIPEQGSLVVLEDRSRVAHLEGEVHRLDRLAGLSELALGIAHEIKNPLNGVMGFASLMQRSDDPDTIKRFGTKVISGLDQVDSIVKAMLGFAVPDGKDLAKSPVCSIIGDAASTAGLPSDRITIVGDADGVAESKALVRVLANLFSNSIEARGDGSVAIAISIAWTERELVLTIEDDGPGVSVELAGRLFEPFVSSKESGHGLGLALSARVLDFLGGSVELANPGDAGARFVVKIPRTKIVGGRTQRQ